MAALVTPNTAAAPHISNFISSIVGGVSRNATGIKGNALADQGDGAHSSYHRCSAR